MPIRLRRFTAALAIVAAAAAVAIGVWLWIEYTRERPLPPDWSAVAIVLAGDGVAGTRDGHAGRARFSNPFGVSVAPDGTVYVTDAGAIQAVRRIAPDGTVSTVAGSEEGYLDGYSAVARFDTPSGIAVAADGTIYVADTGNNAIRRISPEGYVSTAAGDGAAGYQDGAGHQARFHGPTGVALGAAGRVIVADTYNDRIRAIEPDGRVVTIAGTGVPGAEDGPSSDARFHTPCGVAADAAGNIFVADTGNGVVRAISADGFVTTLDGWAAGGLVRPIGIALSPDGDVYVSDDRGRIVEIARTGGARLVAGWRPGFADGPGNDARFRGLTGLAVTAPGRIVAADPRNALIRLVAAPAALELRPPAPPGVAPTFDVDAFSLEPLLWPLAPMDGPFEITGTLGELRGGEGTERFHSGLDVFAREGASVLAVRDGVVVDPVATGEFGTLNEWVRVGPLTYVHLRVGRDRHGAVLDPSRFVATYDETGRLAHVRVKRGARFRTGDVLGTINLFNHVHLNVGWPGEEHNPLHFRLVQFEDRVRPRIAPRGIRLFGEEGEPLSRRRNGRVLVDGLVRIVVDAWDQVDGNELRRRLGLYQLGYQVLHRDGTPAPGFDEPRLTIRFDRLAPDSEAARLVYASGSGIPFYGRRRTRFLYVVTNTLSGGVATAGAWDTTSLPPGDYTLRILAADFHGNLALANRDVPITRIVTPAPDVDGTAAATSR